MNLMYVPFFVAALGNRKIWKDEILDCDVSGLHVGKINSVEAF